MPYNAMTEQPYSKKFDEGSSEKVADMYALLKTLSIEQVLYLMGFDDSEENIELVRQYLISQIVELMELSILDGATERMIPRWLEVHGLEVNEQNVNDVYNLFESRL